MRKIRKKTVYLLICILLSVQLFPINAYGEEAEWYEMVEEDFESTSITDMDIQPYMLYIVDVITTITKISSTKASSTLSTSSPKNSAISFASNARAVVNKTASTLDFNCSSSISLYHV